MTNRMHSICKENTFSKYRYTSNWKPFETTLINQQQMFKDLAKRVKRLELNSISSGQSGCSFWYL